MKAVPPTSGCFSLCCAFRSTISCSLGFRSHLSWGNSSVVEQLPSIYKVLGAIISTPGETEGKKEQEVIITS